MTDEKLMWVMGREWPWHVKGTTFTVSGWCCGQHIAPTRLWGILLRCTDERTGSHCGRRGREQASARRALLFGDALLSRSAD